MKEFLDVVGYISIVAWLGYGIACILYYNADTTRRIEALEQEQRRARCSWVTVEKSR